MSEQLKEMVQRYLIEAGDNGMAKLSAASDVSVSTIVNVLNGHIPLAKNVRRLAKACGCSDEEATALGMKCASERAKESA